jgi:oligopeptide/dipeptide ABC transporter ATP-binding protein
MRRVRGGQIAMVFQDPMTSLNAVLTVGYQIVEALKLHLGMSNDEARDRAQDLLALVGIPEAAQRLDDYPHQFSGGMRQRAMIAMALACDPYILIADEPTTSLDVTIQAQIIDLVRRLQQKRNMSVIWITHDLGVVAGLADRVNVMYAGSIVEAGPVEDVYGDPHHPYTAGLLGSLPHPGEAPGAKLFSIRGEPPDLLGLSSGCPFGPRCDYAVERCAYETPALIEAEPGHLVACHDPERMKKSQ